jgi:hypothetical protein
MGGNTAQNATQRRCIAASTSLDAIGFVWVVNERTRQLTPVTGVHVGKEERFNARWNTMFEKLKEYRAEHGDFLLPQSYNSSDGTKLGFWVKYLRSVATTDRAMTTLRVRALDSIGFVLYRLLQEHHAEHGLGPSPNNNNTAKKRPPHTHRSWARRRRTVWQAKVCTLTPRPWKSSL